MSAVNWINEYEQVCKDILNKMPEQTEHMRTALNKIKDSPLPPVDAISRGATEYIVVSGDPTGLMTEFKERLEISSKAKAAKIFANLDRLDWS